MTTKLLGSLTLTAVAILFVASAPVGRTAVIDWDFVPWVDGVAIQSLDLNGDTVNDLFVSITGSVLGSTPLNGPAPYTGGLFPHKALQLWTDPGTPGGGGMNMWITFLPGGLYDSGARNLTFSLFDVDGDGGPASGRDFVASYATRVDGVPSYVPVTIGTPPFNNAAFNWANGTAIANDNSAEGTVTMVYGNDAIREFLIHYENPISPANGIALGDLSFDFDVSPVPEAGTVAACAVFTLLGAWGLRRMRRAQPEATKA